MKREIHPRAVPGESQCVLWVTAIDLPTGRVLDAPGAIGPLLEYGVLTKVLLEKGGVWTWLAEGQTWTEHGPRIRDAISAAVDLDGWQVDSTDPELLGMIAHDVIDGQLRTFISSHGGCISIAEVSANDLVLDFGGACESCPAAGVTLHDRIENAIRDRYPSLGTITQVGSSTPRDPGWLGLPRR